ncbi:MAG: SRPBCC family protein [Actinomycetota bacterium]|nr:SRPBCC family protein [Actinomycetota bacterium]
MPPSKKVDIEVSRAASCDPESVIALVRDPKTWPRWQPEILSTQGPAPLEPGDDVYGHASMLGFRVEGHSKTIAVGEGTYEEDVVVGVRMRIVYRARRDGDGRTVVTRRLSALLPGGVAGRLLSFFLKRRLTAMQNGVVDELVRQVELKR